MKKSLIISFCVLLIPILCLSGDIVGKKSPGKWVAGTFVQENLFCTQTWLCTPGIDLLHDSETRVVTSASSWTQGVCNAGGGATDSCNFCSANLPKDQCQFWLEKKE